MLQDMNKSGNLLHSFWQTIYLTKLEDATIYNSPGLSQKRYGQAIILLRSKVTKIYE